MSNGFWLAAIVLIPHAIFFRIFLASSWKFKKLSIMIPKNFTDFLDSIILPPTLVDSPVVFLFFFVIKINSVFSAIRFSDCILMYWWPI